MDARGGGTPAILDSARTRHLSERPHHLADWELPVGWEWGQSAIAFEHRVYQEVIDALGRSLALVTAPDPQHAEWLWAEAVLLGGMAHASVPTTYHAWVAPTSPTQPRRGPGYLRRWVQGEHLGAHIMRGTVAASADIVQVLRVIGSLLVGLHEQQVVHGALAPDAVWLSPTGRVFVLGWLWAASRHIPEGLAPDREQTPWAPEWTDRWAPTRASDQWQLAALAYAMVMRRFPQSGGVVESAWAQDLAAPLAAALERALQPDPLRRFASVSEFLRALDSRATRRVLGARGPSSGADDPVRDGGMPDWAGLVGDDYQLMSALGAGSFGEVWRVRDTMLGREVALKVLHPAIVKDRTAVARFVREARLAGRLAHPGIVSIHDLEIRADVCFYTMELCDGGSVAQAVEHEGSFLWEQLEVPVAHLLDALGYAHAEGVVHRDLKPENVLRSGRLNTWRITDFGLAPSPGERSSAASGSPAFAAPEQFLAEPQTSATDLFSFAATVYFALAGCPPFGIANGRVILARQFQSQWDRTRVPVLLVPWFTVAFAVDPQERYPDAHAMRCAWDVACHARRRGVGSLAGER